MTVQTHFIEPVIMRGPRSDEGQALHNLVRACPPLDVNSVYCYHLLARHFAGTCVVAEAGGSPVGCVTGYRVPGREETLFVWQVAVLTDCRGRGLAGRMLEALLEREACRDAAYIETTVGPSNRASRRCFERLADAHGCRLEEQPFLSEQQFEVGAQHEAEGLLRIGPISPRQTSAS